MAKIAFTKLGLKINNEVETINWNEQQIEVKKYLPINDKLELISKIVNSSIDNIKFYNPCKVNIFTSLYIIFYYTNINFTDKQKEDVSKLYDLLINSGFYKNVVDKIPNEELIYINNGVNFTIKSIYEYQNSIYGILDNIKEDYNSLSLDATEITDKLKNGNGVELVKEVIDKLS